MKNKISSLTKDEIVNVLNKSKSFSEVLYIFGYSKNGSGSYATLKNHLFSLGIEVPKYHYYGEGGNNKKILLSEILIENSTYLNRNSLKKRLLKDKIFEYKCVECGNNGEWNGRKLTLQLEHKNGINNDNRIENLAFLCPNCHSQTNTYSGKNNKIYSDKKNQNIIDYIPEIDEKLKVILDNKKKYCDCGKQINRYSNHCNECSIINKRKVKNRPSKEELYLMMNDNSLESIGRKYNVSGNTIKKWLNK